MKNGRRPLDEFPLIRTQDVDALRVGFAEIFADSSFEISSRRDPVDGWVNYRPLQKTALQYGSYGAAIQASFGDVNYYVQGFSLSGHGEQETNRRTASVDQTHAGVLSPGDHIGLKFESGFEHLALIVDPAAMTSKLGALIGAPTRKPLQFQGDTDFTQPAARRLRGLVEFLVEDSRAAGPQMPPAALAEIEQLLMLFFLHGSQHNYSHLLDGGARHIAPWQVRRVEEYIEAHWDQPLTVESLALATGASVRSIFYSFKESRGYTPMMFLKQVRLKRARDMLSNPLTDTSVTDAAYACAFNNLGHFAKDYFQAFGERPSETLKYAKGARRPKGEH